MKHRTTSPALGALFLVSFFACNSSTPAEVVVEAGPDSPVDGSGTLPDSSVTPDSSETDTGPADVASDAAQCDGHIAGYVPPAFAPVVMQACASDAIDAYVTACGPSDGNPQCLSWKADPMNAACKACILRDDHTGPLRFYNDGTFASINEGACLAVAGDPTCGAAADAAYYCLFDACGNCPADAGQLTGACYETVYQGDCKSYSDAQATCESTLTGSIVDCEDMNMFDIQLKKTVTLLCGIPGDAGPTSDSGAADASEAGAADASEAGTADATPE